MKTHILIFATFLIGISISQAQIINIPEDFPTIQQGIDRSSNGDTVLVAPGIYVENINLYGKKILLTSNYIFSENENDIKNTIIDGNNNGSVVTFNNDEDTTTILNGFKIINGNAEYGGGIYCGKTFVGPNPIFNNLIISNNTAIKNGGGVYILNSNARLLNSKITNNNVGGNGGGVCYYSNNNSGNTYKSYINNCTLSNNSAYSNGGGIYIRRTIISISSSIVKENESFQGGGIMIYLSDSSSIINCDIEYNTATDFGGGLFVQDCDNFSISVSKVNNNISDGGGGCSFFSIENIIVNNVLFAGNSCPYYGSHETYGGAIFALDCFLTFINSTFVDNQAFQANLMLTEWTDFEMINTICETESEFENLIIIGRMDITSHNAFFYNCNIRQGYPTIYNNGFGEIFFNEETFWADSKFVGVGPDPYQISAESPCRDAGTSDTTGLNLPQLDLAGNNRINNQFVDIGAYEWDITVGKPESPKKNLSNSLIIYPNPAQNEIHISINGMLRIKQINIYNKLGQKVLGQNKPASYIDISGLEKSSYVMEVITKHKKLFAKFIKN
ncbi:MAG: T9SS type A sorting domain-containing protein [Chlorobi bacterium]|nr:T9SS type A sorting domain-containing protein [Chlorobiota bacterium]